jgi:hypothetical protein
MKLWNDFHFRSEADDLQKQLTDATLSADQKKALTDRIAALVRNIQTDELKPK